MPDIIHRGAKCQLVPRRLCHASLRRPYRNRSSPDGAKSLMAGRWLANERLVKSRSWLAGTFFPNEGNLRLISMVQSRR